MMSLFYIVTVLLCMHVTHEYLSLGLYSFISSLSVSQSLSSYYPDITVIATEPTF